ncbi:class I adenylate-forming enzyme family protein [Gimibacter soli]|uniref:Class I adenylate-forming enzyme family protein n=1 Tax=Gimibacter soli TaxID=3024400 RepID=A0AAE9XK46_9PROT|nr:class I adenylate-forming enzyme family protein [Gimibacter soli]WCL52654.1 class I adenylate-forming enzyme family protein [Gimibacter soli]
MLSELVLPPAIAGEPVDATMLRIMDAVPMFARGKRERDGVSYDVFEHCPPSLREMFMIMMTHAEKEYLICGDDRLTFRDTLDRAARFAQALVGEYGLKKGQPVGLAMRNNAEWVIAYMGIIAAGGVVVAMNAWWGTEELEWALDDSGARLLVVDQDRANRLQARHAKDKDVQFIMVRGKSDGERIRNFGGFMDYGSPMAFPPVDLGPTDDAMIVFTSGSSGFPKGAVSTHEAIAHVLLTWMVIAMALKSQAAANGQPVPDDYQPVMLVAVPFFHVTGLVPVMLVSAMIGRKLVLMHKWDVKTAFELIEREGVTGMTGVPTMSYELAASPLRKDYNLSTLVDLGGGGAARPPEHVKLIKDAFKEVRVGIGYGLTETNSLTAMLSGDEYVARPNSTGKPTPPTVQVKIMGADGTEMPTGENGEIWIKTIANVRGYWQRPEETARAFTGGWFHSGDIGHLDKDGYLYIVDRLKDIIIRGGENISTLEVEGVLHAHPAVDDVMVFSLPDERLGEIVGAVLVMPDETVSVEDIKAEAAKHLAYYKLPERVWRTAEPLPQIASGKIDRSGIRNFYRAAYADEMKKVGGK